MSKYSKVQDFLRKCYLLEYYDRFISEGFDQLQSLLDVTESDLIVMDVKRGHRRRLQREIATAKGFPPNAPLHVQYGPGLEDQIDQTNNGIYHSPNITQKILYINGPPNKSGETTVRSSSQQTGENDQLGQQENGGVKRKYKRHPKRDKNAPRKPLSAYVMFAHRVRGEYAGQNISFPDMAKIVGDRWKSVLPEVKEAIESEAAKKKEEYQVAMAMYKTTDSWKKYQEYLKEFKEKYESNSRDLNKRKRHKIGKKEASPDSDNTTPSGYSSTRSASIGYDNGSSSSSSGSGNGNGNGHNHAQHNPTSSYSNNGYPPNPDNYIPPYSHYNPTVPYGFTSNNDRKNVGRTFLTPSPSINTSTPPTTLADFYAEDDSKVGSGSNSSNGSSNRSSSSGSGSSSSSRRPNFEDSDNSVSSSSDSTPPAVFMETDNNIQSQQQSSQDQPR